MGASVAFNIFWDIFLRHFNDCFTIRSKLNKPKRQNSPRLNAEIAGLRKEFLGLLSLRHVYGNDPDLKNTLKANKRKYRAAVKGHNIKNNNELISKSGNFSSACWGVISNLRPKETITQSNISPEIFNNSFINKTLAIVKNIANSQNNVSVHFEQYFTTLVPTIDSFILGLLNELEVLNIIKSLKNSNASDFYGVNVNFVKSVCHVLTKPLKILINKCFQEGFFPHQLKISKITPVFKKGRKNDPLNYRPIAMTPILSKILEKAFNCNWRYFSKSATFFQTLNTVFVATIVLKT